MNNLDALPTTPAAHAAGFHRWPWGRLLQLLHFTAEYLLPLPVGAAIALVWVNTDPERIPSVTSASCSP